MTCDPKHDKQDYQRRLATSASFALVSCAFVASSPLIATTMNRQAIFYRGVWRWTVKLVVNSQCRSNSLIFTVATINSSNNSQYLRLGPGQWLEYAALQTCCTARIVEAQSASLKTEATTCFTASRRIRHSSTLENSIKEPMPESCMSKTRPGLFRRRVYILPPTILYLLS